MQLKVVILEAALAENRLVPETIMDAVKATLARMNVSASLSLVDESPIPTVYHDKSDTFHPIAKELGLNVVEICRREQERLLKVLLTETRRWLSVEDQATALAAITDLLRRNPGANLTDVCDILQTQPKPYLLSFASDVRAAFSPA